LDLCRIQHIGFDPQSVWSTRLERSPLHRPSRGRVAGGDDDICALGRERKRRTISREEERPMSLKDAIEDTIYQYAWGYDDDDIALLAGAFAESATLNHALDGSTLTGPAEIHEWMDEKRGVYRAAGEQPRHMLANIVVTQESDTEASSRCYMTMMVTRSDGTVYPHHAGRYFDRFIKVGDRWLFSERLIRVDRDVDFAHRKTVAAAGS
jgi:hypothetical protein